MGDKVFTFLMITVIISVLMYYAGVVDDNNSITLIISIINGNFTSTSFWVEIVTILAAVGAIVASIGLVAGNSGAAITGATITLSTILIGFANDSMNILSKARETCVLEDGGICSISYYILVFIFTFIVAGFGYSLIQFALGGID